MSIRFAASVCQFFAVISVPRSARMTREGSCWVKVGFVAEVVAPLFSVVAVMWLPFVPSPPAA